MTREKSAKAVFADVHLIVSDMRKLLEAWEGVEEALSRGDAKVAARRMKFAPTANRGEEMAYLKKWREKNV